MATKKIQVNGVNLSVIDEGEGTPVMFLHGFPDRGSMWSNQIDAVVGAGYRAVAPDLRGFGDSDAPDGVDEYGLFSAVTDLAEMLDALGIEQTHVVGHDWGAALAWIFATVHGDRTLSLTAVSVGHPSAFASAGLEQRQRSWYMLAFQFKDIAEQMVMADDFAFLAHFGDDGERKQWVADLSRPGRMTSALNWYRANVPPETLLATGPGLELPPVAARTMGVWSSNDEALTEAQMKNSANHVAGGFRYERIEGVSHWIPTVAADQLNALLLDFLAS